MLHIWIITCLVLGLIIGICAKDTKSFHRRCGQIIGFSMVICFAIIVVALVAKG